MSGARVSPFPPLAARGAVSAATVRTLRPVDLDRGVRSAALDGPALRVDLDAVAANVRAISGRTGAAVMAVVKADAFGHGMIPVARTAVAAGASWLGVTEVAEARELRAAGLAVPILSWLHPSGIDVEGAIRGRIDVAVASPDEIDVVAAEAEAIGRPLRVHLQVDTGMARGGAAERDWLALMRAAADASARGAVRVIGTMGHLPDADRADPERNRDGSARLDRAERLAAEAGIRRGVSHLAATAATLTDPATHRDLVRIGAGLVGIDPSGTVALRGASRFTAPVVHSVRAAAGTAVGYGGTHVTEGTTNLAVLGVGYADGVPRGLAPEASVAIAGERFRIVGRVSMDQIVVDTRDRRFPRGTTATLWGAAGTSAPRIGDWAQWAGTIPHEIVTGVGPRVRKEIA